MFLRESKKSQFFILSGVFLLLTLYFIYSQEITTSYIGQFDLYHYTNNIEHEVCDSITSISGQNLTFRIDYLKNNLPLYCDLYDFNCSLTFDNSSIIPPMGNWSLVNYSLYNVGFNLTSDKFAYLKNITC